MNKSAKSVFEDLSVEQKNTQLDALQVQIESYKLELEKRDAELDKQKSELEKQDAELEKHKSELAKYKSDAERYKAELEWYKRQLFGQKRERFEDVNQIALPFSEDVTAKKEQEHELEQQRTSVKEHVRKRTHPGREALPEHLEVQEEHIHPEGDLSQMSEIRTEKTDILELVPSKLFIRRIIRHIYSHKDTHSVHTPELEDRINPKSIAGTSILATLLVEKFVDHLPIHRQLERFNRIGYKVHANTAYDWVQQPMEWLELLYQRQRNQLMNSGYLMMDETSMRSLQSSVKGKSHTGWLWVVHDPLGGATCFLYARGRSQVEAEKALLPGFKGYLQSDGYAVYEKLAKREGITHLCCWAHARREFFEAKINDKARAEMALAFITELYKVEEQARSEKLSPENRKELRLQKSLPLFNAFGKWLFEQRQLVLPRSAIGKAMNYTLTRWVQLRNYLHDGCLEIDNNWIENKIRPVALGRKNFLFAGNDKTAQHAAMMYSFFATCKRHGVNEYEWLKFVLDNITSWKMEDIDQLLPQNYAKFKELV